MLSIEKRLSLSTLFGQKMPSIIALVETWLDISVTDSNIFCGLPCSVIARADRGVKQQGGLLIALHNNFRNNADILDTEVGDFYLSCLIRLPSTYLAVLLTYLPPKSSKLFVSPSLFLSLVTRIIPKYLEHCSTDKLEILILSDFNFPNISWDSPIASNSLLQRLIDCLTLDYPLDQIVRIPTQKRGNILDLAFVSQPEPWECEVLEAKLSDHFPPILNYEMDNFFRFESQSDFSQSSFDCQAFELLVCSSFADCVPSIDYPAFRLSNITIALSASCQKKRKRRQTLPFFYSSITVHCLNKLESARRPTASFSALLRLEKEVSDFIELNKACFLDSCKHLSTNEAFKILRRLNGRGTLPKEMFWRDSHASTNTEKANMLNKYFQSVFIESTCSAGTLPQMANPVGILSEVTFSVNQITKLLEIVQVYHRLFGTAVQVVWPDMYTLSSHIFLIPMNDRTFGSAHTLLQFLKRLEKRCIKL